MDCVLYVHMHAIWGIIYLSYTTSHTKSSIYALYSKALTLHRCHLTPQSIQQALRIVDISHNNCSQTSVSMLVFSLGWMHFSDVFTVSEQVAACCIIYDHSCSLCGLYFYRVIYNLHFLSIGFFTSKQYDSRLKEFHI